MVCAADRWAPACAGATGFAGKPCDMRTDWTTTSFVGVANTGLELGSQGLGQLVEKPLCGLEINRSEPFGELGID